MAYSDTPESEEPRDPAKVAKDKFAESANQIPIIGSALNSLFSGPKLADQAPLKDAQGRILQATDGFEAERAKTNFTAPTAVAAPDAGRSIIDQKAANQIRAQQQGSLDSLTAAANGTAPSAAEIMLRQKGAQDEARAFGRASALGGRSVGGALSMANETAFQTAQDTNAQATAARAAEQATARGQLVGALSGVRGQDLGVATDQAKLSQTENLANQSTSLQTNLANLKAKIDTMGLTEQAKEALLAAQLKSMGLDEDLAKSLYDASSRDAAAKNSADAGIIGGATKLLGL